MSVEILVNNGASFGRVLAQSLKDASLLRISTAYLNYNGLKHVIDSVERILQEEGEVSVIHGLYPIVTETDVIRKLAELDMDFKQMNYGVFNSSDRETVGNFHPKLYLTQSPERYWQAIIGSSNLTKGGLKSNLEVNCILSGTDRDPTIERCREIFKTIESDKAVQRPNSEWIATYNRIRELELKNQRDFHSQKEILEAYDRLNRLYQEPPWPAKTRLDCVVQALQNLESRSNQNEYHHLTEITPEARRIADGRFEETHFAAGVRQQLNTNTIYRDEPSKQLFERQDGDTGHSGFYRLSAKGRRYRG